MDSKLLPPAKKNASSKKHSCNTSSKILAVTGLLLCVTAIVVAGAAITVVTYPYATAEVNQLELEVKEKLHSMLVEMSHNVTKRQVTNPRLRTSCYSNISSESIPVAQIEGRGIIWDTTEPPASGRGYQARWSCSSPFGNSYVNGGMNFSQEDQRLYFPTCGYYYISSQVLFQYSSQNNEPNQQLSSFHGIEVQSNCGSGFNTFFRFSHASLPEVDTVRASTYIGDVFQICAGGSMRVFIPSLRNLCCAQGDSSSTHFSAYLIQSIDCPQ